MEKIEKTEYDIETRWRYNGKMLAFGHAATSKTLKEARAYAATMKDVTRMQDFDSRIVKVTTTTTKEVLWLEGSDSGEKRCSTCLLHADGECGMCKGVRS